MPNTIIPITLSWGPVANPEVAYNINQLGTLIAKQLAATVIAGLPNVDTVSTDPLLQTTPLIFNYTQGVFKWFSGGRYIEVTSNKIGDKKESFVGADDLAGGWFLLNGRVISAIPGATTAQQTELSTLFPANPPTTLVPTLPTVTPQVLAGLPGVNAFDALTIGAAYVQAEIDAFRDVSQDVLTSLHSNSATPMYALVYAGPP